MPKYKLSLSYDGTNYVGWQVQPTGISIQGLLEEALKTLYKQSIRVIGAGRTDAGVHALEQVAHFQAPERFAPATLQASLNGLLPSDIRILAVEEVPATFHAQYGAFSKIYHYHLCLNRYHSPFTRLYAHRPKFSISLPLLHQGAQRLIGTHDFTSFTNVGGGSQKFVRTLHRLDIVNEKNGIRLEFEGDGFGYKMVRNLVGWLLSVASGKSTLDELEPLFAAKDRKKAPPTAPAQGLFLVKVIYEKALNESTWEKERSCCAFRASTASLSNTEETNTAST